MRIKLIIVGSGAVAAEITSMIEDTDYGDVSGIEIKGYLEYDYNLEPYYSRYNYEKPVLGNLESYAPSTEDYFVIGVANVAFRKTVIDKLGRKGAQFVNLIHNTAIIARTANIGVGNIINPYCVIGPNARIGDFNLLTTGTIISHDCQVGSNNIFSTGLLCGHVSIKDDNYFGIRGTVIPHISIGNRNTIQAGMILDKNISDDTTVFHRFKEKIFAIPRED